VFSDCFVLHIVMVLLALLALCCGGICNGSAHHVAAWLWHCAMVLAVVLHIMLRHFLHSCHGFVVCLALLHIMA